MYKHILIATDGSELGAKAVDQGLDLAKQLGAKVTAITVTEPWTAAAYGTIPTPTLIKVYDKAAADNAARILASVSNVAKKKQVACDALHAYGFAVTKDQPRADFQPDATSLLRDDIDLVNSRNVLRRFVRDRPPQRPPTAATRHTARRP